MDVNDSKPNYFERRLGCFLQFFFLLDNHSSISHKVLRIPPLYEKLHAIIILQLIWSRNLNKAWIILTTFQDISRCLLWTQRHHQTWPKIRTDSLSKPIDLLMLNRLKESHCQLKVSPQILLVVFILWMYMFSYTRVSAIWFAYLGVLNFLEKVHGSDDIFFWIYTIDIFTWIYDIVLFCFGPFAEDFDLFAIILVI